MSDFEYEYTAITCAMELIANGASIFVVVKNPDEAGNPILYGYCDIKEPNKDEINDNLKNISISLKEILDG